MKLKRPLPDWARWLLVVPSALAAFGVVQVVVALILTLSPLQSFSPWLSDRVGELVNDSVGPYYFVYVGSLMAPTRKRLSAIVLATVFVILMASVYALLPAIGLARLG